MNCPGCKANDFTIVDPCSHCGYYVLIDNWGDPMLTPELWKEVRALPPEEQERILSKFKGPSSPKEVVQKVLPIDQQMLTELKSIKIAVRTMAWIMVIPMLLYIINTFIQFIQLSTSRY